MKQVIRILLSSAFVCMLSLSSFAQTTLTAVDGAATVDGVLSAGEYTGQSLVTGADVTLYAMGDGEYLYIAAQWTDVTTTESVDKNMWTYDGTTWTKSGNEDRFAFIWDMGLNGTEGASCQTMCHGTTMGTSTGMVDVWHWKAARGGTTMGVVDGKHWLAETDGRHSDSGTSAYSSNGLDANGNPTFMQAGGPATAATFLAKDQAALDIMTPATAHPAALATAFDVAAGWTSGDTVPGYVLRVPDGDRASVKAHGTYDNGVWTVEFKKPYAGSAGDFTVVPGLAGSSINFTHDSFDDTGGGHAFDGTFDNTVYTLDFSSLSAGSTTLAVTTGSATLDGVLDTAEWNSSALVTNAGVSMYSMADGNNLYVAAQWVDYTGTESVDKKMWTYDGTAWSQSGNEDRFGIIWDMGLNGTDGASCQSMCHGTEMKTSTGIVDVWHWKAARGGTTMGVTDDKWWDTAGRHSDPGTSAYSDNSADANGNPTFMQTGGPSVAATFLATDQAALDIMTPVSAHPAVLATAFDPAAGWASGDTVPGYVLRVTAGDRGNVEAMGKYTNGVWTVEFKKPYAGSAGDFTVAPGSTINFTHDSFDNTGGGHAFDGTLDTGIYTLDFATITGIQDQIASDVLPTDYTLDQNYPNPFNPSTRISFRIADHQHIKLNVYDTLGRLVRTLVDREMIPGTYQVDFSGTDLASGIYVYTLEAKNGVQARRMVLLK